MKGTFSYILLLREKGGVVGKSWLVFVAVFHVNNLFVSLSYTFHSNCCSGVVHFLFHFCFQ